MDLVGETLRVEGKLVLGKLRQAQVYKVGEGRLLQHPFFKYNGSIPFKEFHHMLKRLSPVDIFDIFMKKSGHM
jgi:hypothetical protein